MADGRRARGAELIGHALPGIIPSLLPKLRKVQALKLFSSILPPEIAQMAAAFDIRLMPASERFGRKGESAQLNTLHVYCLSSSVSIIIEQQQAELIAKLNAQMPYPLVEALHCEQASSQKIAQQLNNLRLGPD
jgi:hypothetical protein